MKELIDQIVSIPILRKLFAMDERGVFPSEEAPMDERTRKDLLAIILSGCSIVLVVVVVYLVSLSRS